jgi:hypothetical protein
MSLWDGAGIVGVILMLSAYAAAQVTWLDPVKLPSLLMNLIGSCLVMASLTKAFNLSAFLMEAAWAAVALFGLVRLAVRGRRRDS